MGVYFWAVIVVLIATIFWTSKNICGYYVLDYVNEAIAYFVDNDVPVFPTDEEKTTKRFTKNLCNTAKLTISQHIMKFTRSKKDLKMNKGQENGERCF